MNNINRLLIVFLSTAVAITVSGLSSQAAGEEFTSADRIFTLKVLPLLKEKCLGCHGADPADIKGDYSILSRESLLKGGESKDAAVVPGNAEKGTLLAAVRWEGLEMPPKENDRLTEAQIKVLEEWVKSGAPWPTETIQEQIRREEASREVTADGRLMRTSGGTSSEWTNRRYGDNDLWAFKPVKGLTADDVRRFAEEGIGLTISEQGLLIFEVKNEARASKIDNQQSLFFNQNPSTLIDAVIFSKLKSQEITPAPRADARTLIRRAYFDLLGLPPTPKEVDAFLTEYKKDADKAWESLVDRLLASPHFGEHWAGHWFDVVRYADTGGMANDYERSNMWRYRDYVIRAFNNDKPYDEFVMEQIAGDEIADQMALKRLGGDETLLSELQSSGQYSPEEAEKIIASGFLRLGPWDNAMVSDDEARQIYLDDVVNAVGQTYLSTTKEKDKILAKQEQAAKAWYEEHNLPYKTVEARKNDPDDQKPPRHVGLDHVEEGQLKVREQDEWIWNRNLERYQPMVQGVYNASSTKLAWNAARKLRVPPKRDTQSKLVNFILAGGALEAKGDAVGPGVLSALGLPAAREQTATDPYLLTDNRQEYLLLPGYYLRTGDGLDSESFAPADGPEAGRVKKAPGAITLQGSFIYSNDGKTIAVITNFYQAVIASAKGITRTTRSVVSPDSVQRMLVYGGTKDNKIRMAYREIWKNISRPSSDVFVEFDLAKSKEVQLQGARIEVIEATSNSLRYRVLQGFTSK